MQLQKNVLLADPRYTLADSFDQRPPRADVPFPTQPPYTAFVGNMSFESSEQDVKDFFEGDAGITVTSVRMITGYDGKAKGFAYAEFPEADMLKAALELTGGNLGGRNVRISVAEPRKYCLILLQALISDFMLTIVC